MTLIKVYFYFDLKIHYHESKREIFFSGSLYIAKLSQSFHQSEFSVLLPADKCHNHQINRKRLSLFCDIFDIFLVGIDSDLQVYVLLAALMRKS